MGIRKIKDAVDLETNEVIYLKGHAKATYLSNGRTVEDSINNIIINGGGGSGEGGALTEEQIIAMGFTKNEGTITEVKMNGASKGSSGVVDLGTVVTEHQDISGKQDKVLKFENVTASNWVSDSTYSDFGYHCDLTCTGATGAMFAEVVFSQADAVSGDYAMVCETMTNVVRIYSKKNVSTTVPTIIIHK